MTNTAPRLLDYLRHIVEAIERIGRYTKDMDELGFAQNQMVQDAVIRNFEIMGEASRNIERIAPGFVAHIQNCRCLSPTKCETCSFTATSKSTSASSGTQSN